MAEKRNERHECDKNEYSSVKLETWLDDIEWCMEVQGDQEAMYITVSFCPFCGVKLGEKP